MAGRLYRPGRRVAGGVEHPPLPGQRVLPALCAGSRVLHRPQCGAGVEVDHTGIRGCGDWLDRGLAGICLLCQQFWVV